MDSAVCSQTDPELWFPPKGGSNQDAKQFCGACDVAAECLAFALANNETHGIWGGLSPKERRQLKAAA